MKIRRICKIEVKNEFVVKGIQLEGVKKICTIEEAIYKAEVKQAEEIFLVDNTKSLFGLEPNYKMLEKAARNSNLPITFGGGITSLDLAMKSFEIGASRIYINTALANNHSLAKEIASVSGRQSLSGGIEYRRTNLGDFCYTHSGREPVGILVMERILRETEFVSEFILTSIDNDGTNNGLDLNLIKNIKPIKVPIILCGGLKNLEYINILEKQISNNFLFSGIASSSSYLINK